MYRTLRGDMSSLFPKPSEDTFNELALTNPKMLEEWILTGRLAPSFLTFAIESLGSISGDEFVPTLLKVTEHVNPITREGAIYGLSHHLGNALVKERVHRLSQQDVNADIRKLATEILTDYGDRLVTAPQ